MGKERGGGHPQWELEARGGCPEAMLEIAP